MSGGSVLRDRGHLDLGAEVLVDEAADLDHGRGWTHVFEDFAVFADEGSPGDVDVPVNCHSARVSDVCFPFGAAGDGLTIFFDTSGIVILISGNQVQNDSRALVMTETFYDRLGVSSDAATEEIETAYREAIKQVHPDVSDDVDAGERTKRLNKAKRVLMDEDERARYDRLGHAGYTGTGSEDATRATDTGPAGNGYGNSSRSSRSGNRGGPDRDPSADESVTGTTGEGESTTRNGGSASRRENSASQREATEDERRRERRAAGVGTGHRGNGGSRVGDWADPGRDGGPSDTDHGKRRSRRRRSADGTTRSRGDSTGPSWQSNEVGASTDSPSARRQAAAGATDGPNLDWSWNAWESTGAWAVRQGADRGRRLKLSRLFSMDQSMVLLGSIFFLYPFFVGTMLYPAFPLASRVVVAVCTLLTFAYLLSIPEAAIAIYGLWSVLVPLAILAFPAVSLFSLVGVIGLTATWVPLGLSVLTFSLLRP